MSIMIWTIIAICFISSFVGLIQPIIPSVVMIWLGFLLYQWFIPGGDLSVLFWVGMTFITVVLVITDIISQRYFLKKSGGTSLSEKLGFVALIIGSFIIPPFGLIIIPFFVVLITEYLQHKEGKKALIVSLASVASFLASTVSKFIIQLIMIIIFFVSIIF